MAKLRVCVSCESLLVSLKSYPSNPETMAVSAVDTRTKTLFVSTISIWFEETIHTLLVGCVTVGALRHIPDWFFHLRKIDLPSLSESCEQRDRRARSNTWLTMLRILPGM